MDPALWELMQEGDSDDEVAAIIRLDHPHQLPAGVKIVARFGETIATCRLPRHTIPAVRTEDPVASLKAPRWLAPEPAVAVAETSLDRRATDERRPQDLAVTGRGVILGVVDWGFDFTHPAFLNPDGSTRILALWDQRSPRQPSPQPYGYGFVYTREAINQALQTADPFHTLGYRPAPGSHGTHVASIAGGSSGGGHLSGIAPEVEFVFVHLGPAGSQAATNLGDSATLLEAVDFIAQVAGDCPLVINTSLGRHGEQHDGTTLVEQGLDAFLVAAPGRAIVQSCGNYFAQNIHTQGQLRPGERRAFAWEVDRADITPNELEVWYSGRDRLTVELQSPDESLTVVARLGDRLALTWEGQHIGNLYHRQREPNTLDHHIDIFLYPSAPAGAWIVTLVGEDALDGRFHVWIERDSGLPYSQSHLDPADAVTRSTTGTICNGDRTIAVGAYDAHAGDRPMAPFSSAGPTRDGRIKPDLAAPGVDILAARSTAHQEEADAPLWMRKSGTSMAAPHVAGTVALMFEAAGRPLPIAETRYWLLTTTDPAVDEPPERVGSGYLNIERAVAAVPRGRLHPHSESPTVTEATMATETPTPAVSDLAEAINRRSRDYIHWLQRALNQVSGTQLQLDGILGPRTRRALRQFQRQQGLAVDGIPGPQTEAALMAAGAPPPPGSSLPVTPPVPPSPPVPPPLPIPTPGAIATITLGGSGVPASTAAPALYSGNSLDAALAIALAQTDSTAVVGDILGDRFEVFTLSPTLAVADPPVVIQVQGAVPLAALVLGGSAVYGPANPTAVGDRWVLIPDAADFYRLTAARQTVHRRRWIQALEQAHVGYSAAQLGRLAMPALRLLIAHYAEQALPVRNVNQPERQFRGAVTRYVSLPWVNFPLAEPRCYLPVIAQAEGGLETINAYDLGAGISIGPIQFNAHGGAIFQFLGRLWERDRPLFEEAFGGFNWSLERQGDRFDLVVNRGTATEIVLQGSGDLAQVRRNVGYFHAGQPGQGAFEQIDPAWRRQLTEQFRRVLAWPHVQAITLEISAEWLSNGLAIMQQAGIPQLGAAPDRDRFVLKALLMSGYVRYNACLRRLLRALEDAPTVAQKLANWRRALATTTAPCPRLEERLGRQERVAIDLYNDVIQPQITPAAPTAAETWAEAGGADRDPPPTLDVAATTLAIEAEPAGAHPLPTLVEIAEQALPGTALAPEVWLEQVLQAASPLLAATMRPALPLSFSPAQLFDAFTTAGNAALRRHYEQFFEVIAPPGSALTHPPQPGDILVRRALGEGGLGHVAMVAAPEIIDAEFLAARHLTGEPGRGGYVQVLEAGILPHTQASAFARRLTDEAGRLSRNQLLLRCRLPAGWYEEGAGEDTAVPPGLDDDEVAASFDLLEQNPPPLVPIAPPLAIPPSDPAPFAPLPPAGSYWPIVTNHPQGRTVSYRTEAGRQVGRAGRSWLADRSGGRRYHVGIDLFAHYDDPVVAIADGEIIRFYPFCCGDTKTTNALFVAHENVVVNYGEVAPDSLHRAGLRVGDRVTAGQLIGYVGRNPGGSTMIHLETYTPGTRANAQWLKNARRPSNLLNPTPMLLHLQEHGLVGPAGTPPGPPPPPLPSPPPPSPTDSGHRRHPDYIRWVQSALNAIANAGLVVDGIQGPRTRAAIRNFQRSRGLVVDGSVGPVTAAALLAAGAPPPPPTEEWGDAELSATVLHQCRPGEGPPAAVPDPEGRGLHPLVYRGTSPQRSRNPSVGDAQQLLNRWLAQLDASLSTCSERSAAVQQVIAQGQATLRRQGQLPLVVDCRFGASTELATKMFQACQGLVQDGKIGPLTWAQLERFRTATPPVPPPPGLTTLNPPRWAPIVRRHLSSTATLRTGNGVTFLIDGPATFRAMVDAIRATQNEQHYIYLLGWSLIDDFELIPGDPRSTVRQLLSAAASRRVQIRALLWDQVGTQNSAEVRRINALPTGAAILDDATLNPISGFGSHHQKVLIVKCGTGLVTFCGGIDLHRDRIQAVGGGSLSSGTAGAPLHDVHCRIVGPAAHDLLETFIRRWDHHPDHGSLDRSRGALLGRREPVPAPLTTVTGNSSTGVPSAVCIARTFNPVTRGTTVPRERDIKNLLVAAIRHAQRFIYMEEQYLIHPLAAAELNAAIPHLQHVTIVIPGSEISDMPCVWKLRREFIAQLTRGLSPEDRDKVRIFMPITPPEPPPGTTPTFGRHTYVHAKTWVFDDELAVIGSANCNRRGWEHDSEVNAFIFDDQAVTGGGLTLAQALRSQLWAEHLNVPASTVLDGVASARLWLTPRPTGARVMPYNPTAGRDRTPDAACDRLLGVIDPTP